MKKDKDICIRKLYTCTLFYFIRVHLESIKHAYLRYDR